jgi:hypothetical protein
MKSLIKGYGREKKVGIHWSRGNPLESQRGLMFFWVFPSPEASVASVFRVVKRKEGKWERKK